MDVKLVLSHDGQRKKLNSFKYKYKNISKKLTKRVMADEMNHQHSIVLYVYHHRTFYSHGKTTH